LHTAELIASVAVQSLLALDYLHRRDIAHRDVNPSNIVFAFDGALKLIDFGSAWGASGDVADDGGEEEDHYASGSPFSGGGNGEIEHSVGADARRMVCDVGTGQYRAPELLFGPRTYDATKIDIWSLGVILCQFLLPLEYPCDDRGQTLISPHRKGKRKPLFQSTWGDIGLAGSIFRLRGSPSATIWPEFQELPDAGKLAFEEGEGVPLRSVLDVATAFSVLSPSSYSRPGPNSAFSAASVPDPLVENNTILGPGLGGNANVNADTITDADTSALLTLLDTLLSLSPLRRPSARAALYSAYFTNPNYSPRRVILPPQTRAVLSSLDPAHPILAGDAAVVEQGLRGVQKVHGAQGDGVEPSPQSMTMIKLLGDSITLVDRAMKLLVRDSYRSSSFDSHSDPASDSDSSSYSDSE
jgi:serine/threonine protein kinase